METRESQLPPSRQRNFYRHINTLEGRQYAEWCLLAADLESCRQIVYLWENRVEAGDKKVAVSLFRDAVVTFISCFRDEEKNLVSLDETALYTPVKGGLESFMCLKTLRDTWVAHRHGVSRQTMATALVDESNGAFRGISCLLMTYGHPVLEKGDEFIKLIDIAAAKVESKENAARIIVEKQVRKWSPSKRIRLPVAAPKVPADSELRMGRNKFSNITKRLRGTRDGDGEIG